MRTVVIIPAIPLYVHDLAGRFPGRCRAARILGPEFRHSTVRGRLADEWSAAGAASGLVVLAIGTALLLAPFLAMVFVAGVARGIGWPASTRAATPRSRLRRRPTPWGGGRLLHQRYVSATIVFPALALWLIDAPGDTSACSFSRRAGTAGLPIAMRLAQQKAEKRVAVQRLESRLRALIDRVCSSPLA